MNITLILPFLLFFFSIVINLLIINIKLNNKKNSNNVHKDLLNRIYSTEKSIKEKLMISEENFTEQQNKTSSLAFEVDRKLKQLQSHGQELAKLSNTLEEYRSMLATLEIATNKTHEWVVKVRNDCDNLEKLNQLIKEHQNETYKIIDSYENAVEKQNTFYGDYEAKLEQLRNAYISEIDNYVQIVEDKVNSKIIALNQSNASLDEKIDKINKLQIEINNKHEEVKSDFKNKIESFNIKKDELFSSSEKELLDKVKEKTNLLTIDFEKIHNSSKEEYEREINQFNILKIEEVEDSINEVMLSLNTISREAFNKNDAPIISNDEYKNDEDLSTNNEKKSAKTIEKEEYKKYEILGEDEEIEIE